jgi:hypothetical protein
LTRAPPCGRMSSNGGPQGTQCSFVPEAFRIARDRCGCPFRASLLGTRVVASRQRGHPPRLRHPVVVAVTHHAACIHPRRPASTPPPPHLHHHPHPPLLNQGHRGTHHTPAAILSTHCEPNTISTRPNPQHLRPRHATPSPCRHHHHRLPRRSPPNQLPSTSRVRLPIQHRYRGTLTTATNTHKQDIEHWASRHPRNCPSHN